MKKVLLAAAAAMGMGMIMFAGCNEQDIRDDNSGNGAESGSLTVTIKNADANPTRAIGEPTQDEENRVFNFTVYVFNHDTDALEKSQTFTNLTTGTVSGLTTTTNKNIVVLVNYDLLTDLTGYTDMKARRLGLESQDPRTLDTDGLFMSGEVTDHTLTDGETIEIGVRRAVAKVRIGTLIVSPDATSDLNQFALQGVSMQHVPMFTNMFGDDVPELTNDDIAGGLDGNVSQSGVDYGDLLYTAYAPSITADTPLSPDIYFYVLPNSDFFATLLTLDASYAGNDAFYTFQINEAADTDTAGEVLIERNKIYTLNITLQALANYVSDPDDNDLVSANIEVVVANWEGEIVQNLVW